MGVRRHGLLRSSGREDSTGPDVGVHGESVVLHLLLRIRHKGRRCTKITGTKRVEGLGGSGRPGSRGVGHGPCLLAVGCGLIWGKASKWVVALLGEEGVVAVGVDDRAGGRPVDELAGGEVFPDVGVGREDALAAGGGGHEDGSVQDVGVERRVVVEAEGGRFPVNGTQRGRRPVEIHVIWVVGGGKVHGGLL